MRPTGKELVKLILAAASAGGAAGIGTVSPTAGVIAAVLQPIAYAVGEYGVDKMMQSASIGSGMSAHQVVERLTESEEGIRLLIVAFQAAQRAVVEEKLRALGSCLAAAVDPDGVVDEEVLLVHVIDNLETYHLRVLRVMTTLRRWDFSEQEVGRTIHTEWWGVVDFEEVDSTLTRPVVEMLIGKMQGQGVVSFGSPTSDSVSKGGEYRITSLGRRVLQRVDAATPT